MSDKPLTYEERSEYCCDVCGNVPDEDGVIEHGKGCYTQSEDGGGTSCVEFDPPGEAIMAKPDRYDEMAAKLLPPGIFGTEPGRAFFAEARRREVAAALREAAASAPPEPLRKLLEEFFVEVEEFAGRVRSQAPTWVRSQLRVILTKYRAEIALAAPPVSAWTAEPPKMGGFWWWRYSKEDKPLPRLVVDRGKLDGCFVHQVCGWVLVQLIGGEWQGPIEPK